MLKEELFISKAIKIGLGCAQFGFDYGLSNRNGKVPVVEVEKILSEALRAGISVLDTANSYGDSEFILGYYTDITANFDIVSKIEKYSISNPVEEWIEKNITSTLERLQSDSLYGLLLHRADDLLEDNGVEIYNELLKLKRNRFVKKIGVSVYNPHQCREITDRFNIDIIQLPLNIFDQRFAKNGFLEQLKSDGIEVHVRSVFLQGLALMPINKIDKYFFPLKEKLKLVDDYCVKNNKSRLEMVLNYPLMNPSIDKIVIGVTTLSELQQILEVANQSSFNYDYNYDLLSVCDEALINPSKWKYTSK